ncbi:hypothetical protein Tco_0723625 [Tanacetum coccineum]
MTSLCSNNIKESLFLKHGLVSRTYSKKSLIMALIFGTKSKSFRTLPIPPQEEPSINRPVNDPRDFTKPVKAVSLPQDVPSTSDRRLIELENQFQRLMEAHLAPKQHIQVNKITSSCEIFSGPHDTHYCIENPKQAFVDYASSRTNEAGKQNRNHSSRKRIHFINSIIILNTKDEAKEERSMKPSATKCKDHEMTIEAEEEVEEEFKE